MLYQLVFAPRLAGARQFIAQTNNSGGLLQNKHRTKGIRECSLAELDGWRSTNLTYRVKRVVVPGPTHPAFL